MGIFLQLSLLKK